MIFILDKQEKIINTLKNQAGANQTPAFFNDLYSQDLTTGAETFSFSAIAINNVAKDLVVGNYVAFRDDNGEYKLFQITQIEQYHEDTMYVDVYAECAGLELINKVFRGRKAPSTSLPKFMEMVLSETGWNIGFIPTTIQESLDLELEDATVYSTLQNTLTKYGVEMAFRCEINNGRISSKYIDLYTQRGRVTGKRFTFGRDIEGIKRKVDSTELFTALIGKGNNGITFKDVTVDGINKPLGQDFVADQNAYDRYNNNGYHIMGIFQYDTDSPEELLRETYKQLQKCKEPKIEYEVSVTLLGELLGESWNKVSIGDTVAIVDNAFNPPIQLMARVSKLDKSFTDNQSDTCTFSNFTEVKSNISNEMRNVASQLENYVDSKFPIKSEDITEGAINGTHMDNEYMTQVTADIVKASTVEANKVVAQEIQAVEGRFETVITDRIEATEGKFQQIVTDEITASEGRFEQIVTDKISAVEGRFETIEADVIEANRIIADLGEFDSVIAGRVEAVEGDFVEINATVGKIDNIISGNISSGNIQTGGITGDNLNMDTIFVSDANIINVNADKITSGEINTNKVHIQSEDGGIVIADNTQQFKDKNGNVRVQIGQDAKGDFNFGVFDETGTGVLIDATGVKEQALADGIIKDRMIGQGEIGGSKIDINSLVTEVNKDSNTTAIKGSKILLDTEGQKLDVAFNTLKTQSDETKKQTESNTTQIGIEQGRINTLIQDTTIVKDGESLKLKDEYSKLEQTVGGISTTVGKHETQWEENTETIKKLQSQIQQNAEDITMKVESTYVTEVFEQTIKSVDVMYYLSTSATSLGGGSWVTTAPQWQQGKYIWTKTVTTYMNGTTQETTPVCISGINGKDGADGSNGADGKGVKSIVEQYYLSTSTTTQSGGSWTTTVPTWTNGKYMWTRSVITYTDNSTTTTNPVCVSGSKGDTGAKGDKGDTGTQGAKGDKGDTGVGISSVDVEYYLSTSATSLTGGSWSTTAPTWVSGKYIWSRTKTVTSAGTTTYSNPACITGAKGDTGATGAQGIQGVQGVKGDKGDKGDTGATGATGKGISKIENYYLASSSSSGVTTSTSGWTTTIQTITTSKKYLWNYEKITYTDSSVTTTTPVIIGAYGNTGATGSQGATGASGKGISSITEYYLVSGSSSGVTTSTSGWSTTIPTMTTTNKYLWNYEIIRYTDGSSSTGTPKVIGVHGNTGATGPQGATGATGATGQGVSSITEEYYLSTSKTSQTGGSWTTTVPTWSTGKYMWTRSKIVYKNPTATAYTTPVCDTSWEVVNSLEPRVSSTELKVTASAILSSVNTQIGAGGQINTTSTILDKTGFTVKNGALKVQNKAGQTVLGADSNGNLWVQNSMTVGGSTTGIINVNNSSGATIFSANKDGVRVKDAVMSITSGTISGGGGITYPSGAKHVNIIGSKGIESRSTTVSGSQQYDNLLTCTTDKIQIYSDNSANALQTHNMSVLTPTSIALQSGTTAGSMPDIFRVTSSALTYNNHSLKSDGFHCQNWLRTYGATGWYSQTYGGGWYMTDSTWIRSYGSKQVYINSVLRADGGLQAGSSGSAFTVSSAGAVVTKGSVTMNSGTPDFLMNSTDNSTQGKGSRIRFNNADNQNVQIRHEWYDGSLMPFGLVVEKASGNGQNFNAALKVEGAIIPGVYTSAGNIDNTNKADARLVRGATDNAGGLKVQMGGTNTTASFEVVNPNWSSAWFSCGNTGIRANSYSNFSDVRLKTNIEKSRRISDRVNKIGIYNYNYLSDFEEGKYSRSGEPLLAENMPEKRWGVLAQEVEEIFPELIIESETLVAGENKKVKSVDVYGLTVLTLEYTKELQEELVEKDQKIADLESRLDNLEKMVKDLLNK